MKQYVTILRNENSLYYQILETMDYKFATINRLFTPYFNSGQLINWLNNERETAECSDWVYIRKEYDAIALYDVSASMDETYTGDYIDPEKRFEMTVENFRDVVEKWEELRVSKPDIILLVIHEDNHVSLETDPKTIQKYQDAGYAFDIDRKYHEA